MTLQIAPKTGSGAALLAMIDADPGLAGSTKTKYKAAVRRYLDAGGDLGDAAQLEAHARTLSASGRAFLKAAVRKLTERLATEAKRQATPDNLAQVQAVLLRIEALQTAIHVEQAKGEKAHIWLSEDEEGQQHPGAIEDAKAYALKLVQEPAVRVLLEARGIGADEFSDRVAEASEGNFLYLYYYAQGVLGGDETLVELVPDVMSFEQL